MFIRANKPVNTYGVYQIGTLMLRCCSHLWAGDLDLGIRILGSWHRTTKNPIQLIALKPPMQEPNGRKNRSLLSRGVG